jgi:hypothetical protein
MSTRLPSLTETGVLDNADGMSVDVHFINISDIPRGFVVVNIKNKQLLLPRQFVALLFQFRDDPNAVIVSHHHRRWLYEIILHRCRLLNNRPIVLPPARPRFSKTYVPVPCP